jgi:superoxide dismutase, Cu-Zn family
MDLRLQRTEKTAKHGGENMRIVKISFLLLAAAGFIFSFALASAVSAEELVIHVNLVNGQGIGKDIGTITLSDSQYGLLVVPKLHGLLPGMHGFHVHQNPDCGPAVKDGKKVAALAAGGHLDPAGTGRHEGPYGKGHLGDLPALYVGNDGKAALPVLAPRLKVADLKGHSVMIHAGGDNYSDQPEKLGGGGARVACGVMP